MGLGGQGPADPWHRGPPSLKAYEPKNPKAQETTGPRDYGPRWTPRPPPRRRRRTSTESRRFALDLVAATRSPGQHAAAPVNRERARIPSSPGPGLHVRAPETMVPWSCGATGPRAHKPEGLQAYGLSGPRVYNPEGLRACSRTGLQVHRLTGLRGCGPVGVQAHGLMGSASRGPPVPSDSAAWARGPAGSRSRGLEAHGPTGPIAIPRSCKRSCENLSTVQECVWAHGPASHQSRGVS